MVRLRHRKGRYHGEWAGNTNHQRLRRRYAVAEPGVAWRLQRNLSAVRNRCSEQLQHLGERSELLSKKLGEAAGRESPPGAAERPVRDHAYRHLSAHQG